MIDKLKEIVNSCDNRIIGQVVKSKANHPLYQWLLEQTTDLPNTATVKERIYVVLTGIKPVCQYGMNRRFYTTQNEYKFCNTVDKCQCYKEYYEKTHVPMDSATIKLICEKRKKTWIERYGADNPSKNSQIKIKRRKTMQARSYESVYAKLKNTKIKVGYKAVIDRLTEYVTPAFSEEEYQGCFRKNKYKWQCIHCDNVFLDHVDYGRIPRCLECNPVIISKGEVAVRDYILSLGFDVIANTKEVLGNREYDIWIPSKNIAIEYNGIYWHSDKWKTPTYHVDKFIQSRDKGVKLIQIFEDDWFNKSEIIKSRLQNLLGVSTRIFGRHCTIQLVSPAGYKSFCIAHHLQGYASASIVYGLYHHEQLVAIMSFGKARYNKDGYELIRYCSIGTVVGGADKLFKHFVKRHQPTKIISYANRCWSNGDLYKKLGFTDITVNDRNIGYWYVRQQTRYHRSTFTKSRLVKLGYDPALTEEQIMEQEGFHKIYDCGNYKFEWKP